MMNTKNTYNSHIEEAISLFTNLMSYDPDTYMELIQSLLKKHNIVERWQIQGFFDLIACSIFEDSEYCYKIEDKVLRLNSSASISEQDGYKKMPEINKDTWDNINILPSTLQEKVIPIAKALFYANCIFDRANTGNDNWVNDYQDVIKPIQDSTTKAMCLAEYALCILNKDSLNLFIQKINLIFFYHLAKSLLNAEYLIYDNYSELLDKVLNYDLEFESYKGGISFPKIYTPYLIKSFLIIAQHEREMCFRVKRLLADTGINRIAIRNDSEENADFLLREHVMIGEKETAYFGKLIKSMVDMSMIDHAFKTTDENIERLLTLSRRLSTVRQQLKHYSGNKENFNEVLDIVDMKMSSMLYSMLQQGQKKVLNKNYFYTLGSKHDAELRPIFHSKALVLEGAGKQNLYIYTRLNNLHKKVDITELLMLARDRINRQDITLYNNTIAKGISNYGRISKIMEDMEFTTNNNEVIKEIQEYLNRYIEILTPAFFHKALEYTDSYINNILSSNDIASSVRIHEAISLLSKLLVNLRKYINLYTNSVPLRFLPIFSYSFYEKNSYGYKHRTLNYKEIEEYNYRNFKGTFFFASLCCSSLNINYLNQIYDLYTNKSQEYTINYYNSMNSHITEMLEENIKQYKETKKLVEQSEMKTDGAINDMNNKAKDIQEQAASLKKEAKDENRELRHQTMQLLGIFAAFLAFVTIAVGESKVAESIEEFCIFCLAYTLGLCVFVFFIKEYTDKQKDKLNTWEKLWLLYGKPIIVIVLIYLLYLAASCTDIFDKNKEKKTKEKQTSATSVKEYFADTIPGHTKQVSVQDMN